MTTGGVIADPAKLRAYAKQLKKSCDQIEQLAREMRRGLDRTDWRDSERAKFEADLTAALRTVTSGAAKIADEHVKTLERKATALDDFRR